MHTSTGYFSLLFFFVILFKVFQNIKRNKEIYIVYFVCIGWIYLMSRSLFSDISATRIIDRKVVQTQYIDMSETHIIGKYVPFQCQI